MASPSKSLIWTVGALTIYPRGEYFHVRGTVRRGSLSTRVRESLNIRANRDQKAVAEELAQKIEEKAKARLGHIVYKSVAVLVDERFKADIGPTDVRILQDFVKRFRTLTLWDIPAAEIIAFVDERQRGNTAETRERFISGIAAFLNHQVAAGQYPAAPVFVRDKKARNPQRRARRAVQQFTTRHIGALIDNAHPTLAIQLLTEWACGARVSSVLQGCALGDLDLGEMTLTFRDTKNGDDVIAALPDSMRQPFEKYLHWRQDQVRKGRIGPGSAEPLFLHYKGRPYKPNRSAWGTQNKTAFNRAKQRAIAAMSHIYDDAIAAMTATGDQREADRLSRLKVDDISLLARLTQHWLRHKFATDVGRMNPEAAMKQGGWRDIRSLNGYQIPDAERQRQLVDARGIPGTNLTQEVLDGTLK